jgi:2-methylcitrate dehydratase PrpD
MGHTEKLASFIATTQYEDIPEDVVALAKRLILDTLGNAVAGFAASSARLAVRTMTKLGGNPQSTVLVTGARTSAPTATFANIMLASGLESDDSILNIGHIAHMCLYPALALAERDGASGRDLLTAFIMAYETGGRVGRGGPSMIRKPDGKLFFGNTGVGSNWTIFSAAAGAARIIGLNQEQTASTLGIAGFTSTVPTGRRWNKPNWNHLKYYPYAFAAQSAVNGAILSEEGFTGDPDIFDGEARDLKANWWTMAGFPGSHPESISTGLGEEWLTRKAGFKPYPSCRFTHGPLDGFRRLIAEHAISAHEIEAIDIHTGRTVQVFKLDLAHVGSEADAEFSMPHVMAMSALGVPVGPQWIAERYWTDPEVEAIKAKVHCHVWDEANREVTEQILANDLVTFPYRVEIRARGHTFTTDAKFAMGDHDTFETRYDDEMVIAKFRAFTEQGMAVRNVQRCVDTVMNLDKLDHVGGLLDCVT